MCRAVTNLETEAPLFRKLKKIPGLLDAAGKWFFQKHMYSSFEALACRDVMMNGGYGYADGIRLFRKFFDGGIRRHIQFLRDMPGPLFVSVNHTQKLRARKGSILLRVETAQMTNADDSGFQIHHDCSGRGQFVNARV